MFRFLSRQAYKAVPRPSRRIHSMRLPYTGPPCYDTIARRFSLSQVDPQAYFTRKHQQEAKDRGEYVDIHDIGNDPADYDVLITDIKHETLETTIAEELGIPYLSKATESEAKEVVRVGNGYIYSQKDRTIIPFIVSRKGEARWVFFFVVGGGCPLTYFSAQASTPACGRKPGMLNSLDKQSFRYDGGYARVDGYDGGHAAPAYVAPSNSHFADVNLLGTDFCRLYGLQGRGL